MKLKVRNRKATSLSNDALDAASAAVESVDLESPVLTGVSLVQPAEPIQDEPADAEIELDARPPGRWVGRPKLAGMLRLVLAVLPIVAGVAAAIAAERYPHPASSTKVEAIQWALASLAAGFAAFAVALHLARRLRPLVMYIAVDLVFPHRAPSRLKISRRTPGPRKAVRHFETINEAGLGSDPQIALETLLTVVGGLTSHEPMFYGHAERVQAIVRLMADELEIPESDRVGLMWAALVHDVGKLALPRQLLNKPDRFTREERHAVQAHATAGASLLEPLSDWLGEWSPAVSQHHERWDGAGYPNSLRGREICLGARILAVADAFDAMTSTRSYKAAHSIDDAVIELEVSAGAYFDRKVVAALADIPDGHLRRAMWPLSWVASLHQLSARAASSRPSPIGVAAATGLFILAVIAAPTLGSDPSLPDELAFTGPGSSATPPSTTTLVPLLEDLNSVQDDEVAVMAGDTILFGLVENDSMPQGALVEVVREPQHGTATAERSVVRYVAPAEAGTDTFWYRTCTRIACGSGEVTVTIQAERPLPSFRVESEVLVGAIDEAVLIENWVTYLDLGTIPENVEAYEFLFPVDPDFFTFEPNADAEGRLGLALSAGAPSVIQVDVVLRVLDKDATVRLSEPVRLTISQLDVPG